MAAAAGQAGGAPWDAVDGRQLIGAAIMVVSGVVTVIGATGLSLEITAGALMLAAGLGLTLARRASAPYAGVPAVGLAIAAGVAVVLLVPDGFGTAPVLIGAALLPRHLPAGRPRRAGIAAVAVSSEVE